MKLRKCTCGGTPKLWSGIHGDELRHVYCKKCGLESLSWSDGRHAMSNWNAIIRNHKFNKREEMEK